LVLATSRSIYKLQNVLLNANNTNSASMTISSPNVYSSAKDASGIAGDVHAELLKRNAVHWTLVQLFSF
jgi:hypothetical protein